METPKKTRCFFSDTPLVRAGQVVYLQPAETRHIQNTLRLQPGSQIRVTDGRGHEATAVIASFSPDHKTELMLTDFFEPAPLSPSTFTVTLAVAFAAKGIMDELVEKGQELGLAAFFPLRTERTVVSLTGEKEEKVLQRWYKITREAAKQSGNTELMRIERPMSIEEALKMIPAGGEAMFLHPGESSLSLAGWLREHSLSVDANVTRTYNLFIGPEGGFSAREITKAQQLGELLGIRIRVISLGRSILRVSTAVVAAIGAIKFSR